MTTVDLGGKGQLMLLTNLPSETIVGITARLPSSRAGPTIEGRRVYAGDLSNLAVSNRPFQQVLSINSKQLKNEIANVQYSATHSLRLRPGDITIDDLREYDVTKWSVRYLVEGLAESFEDAGGLMEERKDTLKIFAAGLYVLEALHNFRIPSRDALPARFLVEAITPKIWALVRFASIGLVQTLRHNNASLSWKHPAWSSSVMSSNAELTIEELIIDGGLGVMHVTMSTYTPDIPSVRKVMRETTRRFVQAVKDIPPYDVYSRQVIGTIPMPEFGFLQGLCKKADVNVGEVKNLMKDIRRDTEWLKSYDIDWVKVVNSKVLSDRLGYWKGPRTILSLTQAAGEVLRSRKTMVDEWYRDLKSKIMLPAGAPMTKEYVIMSLNMTVEECGDPDNPMAGLGHPLWGVISSHGSDMITSMSMTELGDALTLGDVETWRAQNGFSS